MCIFHIQEKLYLQGRPPAAFAVAACAAPILASLEADEGGLCITSALVSAVGRPAPPLHAALLGRCLSEPGLRAGCTQCAHMLTCAKADLANIA